MHNEKRKIEKLLGFFIILLPLLILPTILSGMEANKELEKNSESHGEYVLKVKADHISLKAKDAPLKEILEEIGRRMKIEVVANIPREDKITLELDMMYLGDAIKRFKKNYAYITESDKDKGKITKIVVVPEGMVKWLPNKTEYNPQPPIQNFDRETQPSTQKGKVIEKKSGVKPESRARKEAGTEEPPISKSFEEEPITPEPLEFEYDPQPTIIEKK